MNRVDIWAPHIDMERETHDVLQLGLIKRMLKHVLIEATMHGVVITVQQVSKEPFAMGNYDTIGTVRLARAPAGRLGTECDIDPQPETPIDWSAS